MRLLTKIYGSYVIATEYVALLGLTVEGGDCSLGDAVYYTNLPIVQANDS